MVHADMQSVFVSPELCDYTIPTNT
jgi:hypothetical protein